MLGKAHNSPAPIAKKRIACLRAVLSGTLGALAFALVLVGNAYAGAPATGALATTSAAAAAQSATVATASKASAGTPIGTVAPVIKVVPESVGSARPPQRLGPGRPGRHESGWERRDAGRPGRHKSGWERRDAGRPGRHESGWERRDAGRPGRHESGWERRDAGRPGRHESASNGRRIGQRCRHADRRLSRSGRRQAGGQPHPAPHFKHPDRRRGSYPVDQHRLGERQQLAVTGEQSHARPRPGHRRPRVPGAGCGRAGRPAFGPPPHHSCIRDRRRSSTLHCRVCRWLPNPAMVPAADPRRARLEAQ